MSTISLDFTNGQLTGLDATGPWFASYFLGGHYELSTVESAGHYLVTVGDTPWQNWRTVVDTHNFVPLYTTGELLIFKEPSFPSAAVPEPSTWVLLMIGFACLGFSIFRQRLATVSQWRRA